MNVFLAATVVVFTLLATVIIKQYLAFQTFISKFKHLPGEYQIIHPVFVKLMPSFLKKLLGLKYDKPTRVFSDYANALFNKYNAPFVKFVLGRQFPLVLAGDAEFAKLFALKENKIGDKRLPFFLFMQNQFGPSVLSLADDSKWKRHRLLTEPAFTQKALAVQADVVVNTVKEYMSIIEQQPIRNILDDGCCITLDVIGKAAFGFDFKAIEGVKAPVADPTSIAARTNALLQNFFMYQLSPNFLKKLPLGSMHEIHETQFAVRQVVAEIIMNREEEMKKGILNSKPDILDLLMKGAELQSSESEDPEADVTERKKQAPLTQAELSANCISFLLAGHETTARGLVFCSYLLSKHKEVQKKAQEALDKVLQEREAPDHSDFDALEYVDAIIKETLRLYPVVRATGRKLIADLEFKGYKIPANTCLFMYYPRLHLDPAFWKDPLEFRPERWLEKETLAKLAQNPFQYIPFGFGKHSCIGKRLAMMELLIVLSMLLKKFTFSLQDEESYGEMQIEDTITARPSKTVFIKFEKRQ